VSAGFLYYSNNDILDARRRGHQALFSKNMF
jgi:hypothetical protein